MIDLCGGTGAWSKPYRDAGYDVRVITLPEYDVTDWRMYYDYGLVFPRITTEDDMLVPIKEVHGILAAPPCTHFSLARTTAKTPRDLAGGRKIMEACLQIIWKCREHGSLKFWALENPKGLMRQFLGRPAFHFEQWEFGDCGIKPTDIWGYFNAPKKTVADRPGGMTKVYPCGSSMSVYWNKRPPDGLTKADMRAITPPGFAQAFFRANP